MTEVTIPLRSHEEAILVLGPYDRYAKLMRRELDLDIFAKSGNLRLVGADESVAEGHRRIEHLLGKSRKGRSLEQRDIESILLGSSGQNQAGQATPQLRDRPQSAASPTGIARLRTPARARIPIPRVRGFEPRTENQRHYVEAISKCDLTFGVGTAGTGKTFLAVGCALRALEAGQCKRLVITRPVVEAGEHLGFLPGDVQAKINPYMRPVYDALRDLFEHEDLARLEETGVIEIAPLAYMRGRTLSSAFVILDEAQNTTVGQMRMFLTRMGEGSRMVVTGDPSQTDLEPGRRGGLLDAVHRLRSFQEVGVVEFTRRDIVRHPFVERIVRAYESPSRRD